MGKKILVAYSSKAGSTAEVAAEIGRILGDRGAAVDVRRVEHVQNLESYQAVVAGSAIRIGRWLSKAEKFVKNNEGILVRRPVAFFTVCMTLKDDTPENRKKVEEFVEPTRKILRPNEEAFFAGKVDYKKLPFLTGLMAKMAKAPEGDFRDWGKIRQWASALFPGMLPAAEKADSGRSRIEE